MSDSPIPPRVSRPPLPAVPPSWSWSPPSGWTPAAVSQWEAVTGLVFGWRQTTSRLAYGVVLLSALRGFLLFLRQTDGGADVRELVYAAWEPLARLDAPRAWGACGALLCAGDVLDGFASLPEHERRETLTHAIALIDHTLGQVSSP